jgi:hypothetical protein
MSIKLEDMKVVEVRLRKALAELDALIEALEKPKQWEPRGGYHAVLSNGFNLPLAVITAEQRKFGIVRHTREEAEKARDAMRTHNRLLAYVDEFGGDWEADWKDEGQGKYTIMYSHSSDSWIKDWNWSASSLGTVYMSQECVGGLIVKLESGEVIL